MRWTICLLASLVLVVPTHAGDKPALCLTLPPPDPQGTRSQATLPGGDAKVVNPATAQDLADLRQSFQKKFSVTSTCDKEGGPRVVVRGKGFLVAPGFYFTYTLDVAATSGAPTEPLTCLGEAKGRDCVKKVEEWLTQHAQPK